MKTNKR